MFVDTDLLRMGADFSDSAGTIVQRGANEFSSAQIPAGIFGDFTEAEQFHQALSRARENHAYTMQGHHAALTKLARNATSAATTFTEQDEQSALSLDAARRNFGA